MKKALLLGIGLLFFILTGCSGETAVNAPTQEEVRAFTQKIDELTKKSDEYFLSFQIAMNGLSDGETTKKQVQGEAQKALDNIKALEKDLRHGPTPGILKDISSDFQVFLLSRASGLGMVRGYLEKGDIQLWGQAAAEWEAAEEFKARAYKRLEYLKTEYNLKQ